MEKSKLILISFILGIVIAIVLFGIFAFGAIVGSHLRFFGYKRHFAVNQQISMNNDHYVGKIYSISKKTISIIDLNKYKNIFFIDHFKILSAQGKVLSRNVLKKNEYVYIKIISKSKGILYVL